MAEITKPKTNGPMPEPKPKQIKNVDVAKPILSAGDC